jgi:hypothetical protein
MVILVVVVVIVVVVAVVVIVCTHQIFECDHGDSCLVLERPHGQKRECPGVGRSKHLRGSDVPPSQ